MIAVYARYGLSLEYGEITGIPHLPHVVSKYHALSEYNPLR